jgi:apolipoprotein N-acyltransferase
MLAPSNPILRACVSGLLAGAAFPQVLPGRWAGLVSLVAYVPILLALADSSVRVRRWTIIGWLYVTFVLYHGITNWWVCSWQERTDPYLFASGIALWLFHPFFLMMPFVALASIRRRLGTQWMVGMTPFAIAGFEWLHGQTDASYPWLTTGYALVGTPLAQVAELTGVYGLSVLIAIVNAMVVSIVLRARSGMSVRGRVIGVAALLVLWSVAGISLQSNVSSASTPKVQEIDVLLVQPNEDPWDKWSDTREQVRTHQRLTDSACRSAGSVPDIVIWSETAIPYMIRDPRNREEWDALRRWVDTSGVTLLTGYADLTVYPPGEAPPSARRSTVDPTLRFDAFNAAMVLRPHAPSIPVHRKSMLTPFAERLPFADQLTFAMSWIEWGVGISAWGKGRTRDPLSAGKASVGTIICIESIYPEVASDLVANGADVLCVITNDAWYNGTWGPEQHYDIARMRAIEQRRDVLRCANSGVSGVIRADGTDAGHPVIKPMTQGAVRVSASTRSGRTVYAMVGDPVPVAGLCITVFLLVITRFPQILRNLPFRSTSIENPTV